MESTQQFAIVLERAALLSGTTLAIALPFVPFALWGARTRGRAILALVAALVVLNAVILELPRIGPLQRFHWGWQECVLMAAWPFALVALVPGVSLVSIGATARFGSGWLKPTLVALLVAIAVPAAFFALGTRKSLNAEGWIYLSVMPGLAEELAFRGAIQSLLNRTFGRPWRVFGAPCGWGLVITAILFAGFNGLVIVNGLSARLALPAAIAPLLSSLVSGWVRERAENVWPCVFGHNLSNLVIPLASLLR